MLLFMLLLAVGSLPVGARAADPLGEGTAALEAGRCKDAATTARELTVAQPALGPAWRLLGDAERCLGSPRPAVQAYVRYLELGGGDSAVAELVWTLRKQLGRLRVVVETERPAPIRVAAEVPGEDELSRAILQPDGSWVVEDLVPGSHPIVVVLGTGVDSTRAESPALTAGVVAQTTVRPRWRGIGSIELARAAHAGARVEVLTYDGWKPLESGRPTKVTAGEVWLAVVGPMGRVETSTSVLVDDRTSFDPGPWLPTRLTVGGAPAGAELRLFLEGVEPPMERVVPVEAGLGAIDPEWGIRVAPGLELDGLVGGSGSLVVHHEVLGTDAAELVLEGGAANSLELDWRRLGEAEAVRTRHLAWKRDRDAIRRTTTGGMVAGGSVAGVGAILSVVGWAAAASSSARMATAKAAALEGLPHDDGAAGWLAEFESAEAAERAWIGVGAGGAGVGLAGLAVVGVFGGRGRARLEALGPWVAP
jgi:hypothetical protein